MHTQSDWKEYTLETGETDPVLKTYKNNIISTYGEEALRTSWLKVCKDLETVTEEIKRKQTSIIPEVEFSHLQNLSPKEIDELKSTGVFVVRGLIPREEADEWFVDLKRYVAENRERISGFPKETPFLYRLFWSKAQVAARSHPNQLAAARLLNSWWHDSSNSTSADPLSYADALRIRPPGVDYKGLGPHIDAGSLARWADPHYRDVYSAIWSGTPERHDPYDMNKRKDAKQDLFQGTSHSTVLRAFQGWTALTDAGPSEGSLLVYPNVSSAIAYVLLRPLFDPPSDPKDILDASKWTLNGDSTFFPGSFAMESQRVSDTSHPHLRLQECMVNIPYMRAGDGVYWHCDMCHAVEVEHHGDHDSSVVYVAATPTTELNVEYMKQQYNDFVKGDPPHDFATLTGSRNESGNRGYLGTDALLSGEAGRRAAGYGLA